MKIALAIEKFNRFGGGAESYAVQLAARLIAEGFETHLIGHEWSGEPNGAIFHPISRLPRIAPPFFRLLHFAFAHKRIVEAHDFDVILGFGATIVMNVYQSHGGVHAYSAERKLKAVANPVLRALKRASLMISPKHHARAWIESAAFRIRPRPTIIAISDMLKRDFAEYYGLPTSDIHLVYNGIDRSRFDPRRNPALKAQWGFKPNEVVFLFMSYDFRKKGAETLIRAAGRLRERVGHDGFGVVLVGREAPPALARLVEKLGLSKAVRFPGPTRSPELMYGAADVFALPTFYDACSLVVFEAMSCGLPVITTECNGAAGVLTHGKNGFVVQDPTDVDELAGCMERCLDKGFLAAASENALLTSARYTVEANHDRMIALFRDSSRSGEAKRSIP
jgi:UDP-glucose:(heptosyl)LPS alpha-1,3-glucosyltransferase